MTPTTAPPAAILLQLIGGFRVTQAIYAAARLGIADRLAEGPRTVAELAAATGAHERSLYRLLRALASVGILGEGEERGRFALTPVGELLRRDVPGSLHGQAALMGEPWVWRPIGELFESVRTGETAHARLFGVDIWRYLAEHPDAQATFNAAMSSLSSLETRAIGGAYDFAGRTTVVDLAGGEGALLVALLRAQPGLQGVLFERPQVAAAATSFLDGERDLSGRWSVVAGDLFAAAPAGADLYLLKRVLHDWDDERAVTILRNCRTAMADHARLLVAEPMIPPGNAPHPAKLLDLQMLVSQGGHERTAEELRALLAAAGLELTRIIPTPSMLTLVEARRG